MAMNVNSMDESARKKEEKKEHGRSEHAPAKVELSREEYEALVQKSKDFEALQDRLLRSAADFDNAKKRLVKEREDFLKFAAETAVCDLLPILDNLERALAHTTGEDEKVKAIRDGFSLIHKQLSALLRERGVKRVETVGKPFDPHGQEAVGHIFSQNQPEGIVLEEVIPGYELNGKVIRPAQVKVSTRKSSEEKEEELT